ncbi:MAG: hypothetical protein U5R06_03910 [candidate division KSB1 bacterium]|nr:hypothetical protein [candidate division KSB1 bacterium]
MKKIFALTDYKNHFGSKWKAVPYRSGYDKSLLVQYFKKYGYECVFQRFVDIDFKSKDWKQNFIIYTSSEDVSEKYKQYIEDIVTGLTLAGATVIPSMHYLRAHHNKVMMEILRTLHTDSKFQLVPTKFFGTLEELEYSLSRGELKLPCVIKSSSGAMSRGVQIAHSEAEVIQRAKKLSRTPLLKFELKDKLRQFKHRGYVQESPYQKKFIIQPFVPNLNNDWKVLIYGDQYYVLKRHIKPNDFRASGSGLNYLIGKDSELPFDMFPFIEEFYNQLSVPHLSLDFAFDGKKGYIFEFQTIYFGTSTQHKCREYFCREGDEWVVKPKEFDQEEAYVWGVVKYLEKNNHLLA